MGRAKRRPKPLPVKLFCGLIGSEASIAEAVKRLEREFGVVHFASPVIPFEFTNYYREEMGCDLVRQWIAFEVLRERAYLPRAKHVAVRIERALSVDNKRTVNIDPGYVDNAQVVLATGKNYAHRIYIGMGYYAEATLIHIHGRFRPLEWTYPDCKGRVGISFFEGARSLYRKQMRNQVES